MLRCPNLSSVGAALLVLCAACGSGNLLLPTPIGEDAGARDSSTAIVDQGQSGDTRPADTDTSASDGIADAAPDQCDACPGYDASADAAPDSTPDAPSKGPLNVVVIVTDDQGWADFSAYDHHANDIDTPNLDRIALEGVRFTNGYVTAPVCSPSRAGWNTGRYQQRWEDPKSSWDPGLPSHITTLAERFKSAGYDTAKVGKTDFGANFYEHEVREYPLRHGYDTFLGFAHHGHDYSLLSWEVFNKTPDPLGRTKARGGLGPLMHNRGWQSYTKGYTTEIFTNEAIRFIERSHEKPFFLTVSYNSVHHLIHQVPWRYLKPFGVAPILNFDPDTMGDYSVYHGKYKKPGVIPEGDMRKFYLANLACLDHNVGLLLDTLEKEGLSEDTLVVFFSDNGGSPYTGANNWPLRGSKYVLFEGGVRVPMAMRLPGRIAAGKVLTQPVSTLDIAPTVLTAAGVRFPRKDMDGVSLWSALLGKTPVNATRPLFWRFNNSRGAQFAVRKGNWKLVRSADRTDNVTSWTRRGPASSQPMLFDLRQDNAGEQRNRSADFPAKVQELQSLYDAWWKQMREG